MQDFIEETPFKGLFVIKRPYFPDNRGGFQELWRTKDIEARIGRAVTPLQGNLSLSRPKVLRGIHAEPMDKLITPLTGSVFIAITDIREESETFGKVFTLQLDNSMPGKERTSLFLPSGMANSYCVTGSQDCYYLYAIASEYDQSAFKRSIAYNDPDLAIQWPYPDNELIISDKDLANPRLRELFPAKFS